MSETVATPTRAEMLKVIAEKVMGWTACEDPALPGWMRPFEGGKKVWAGYRFADLPDFQDAATGETRVSTLYQFIGPRFDPFTDPAASRTTFRDDRDGAGIAAKDRRGRTYSAHSARKAFKTVMEGLGVSSAMVERLMRHSIDVAGRYFDPSLEEMSAAIAKFPKLMPETDFRGANHVDITTVNSTLAQAGLQSDRQISTISSGASSTVHPTSIRPPSPGPTPEDAPHLGTSVAAGSGGHVGVPVGTGQQVSSIQQSRAQMPIGALEQLDSTALADLFEALGRLLRDRRASEQSQYPQQRSA